MVGCLPIRNEIRLRLDNKDVGILCSQSTSIQHPGLNRYMFEMAASISPSGDGEQGNGAAFPVMPYKRSQRPSWSCTECARRKIKCDKKVPCQSCVKRGRTDQCRLEGAASLSWGDVTEAGSVLPSASYFGPKQEGLDSDAEGPPRSAATSSSPMIASRSKPVDTTANSNQHTEVFSSALVRLQTQLDRIERRLSKIDSRSEAMEDLTARVTDVEDVIHVLGENRSQWQAPASSPPKATTSPAHLDRHWEPTASSVRSNWAELDAIVEQGSDGRRLLPTASTSAQHSDDTEGPSKVGNAELESRDAATTLEFLTLGKDRRQGLPLNEISSDSEHDLKAFDKQAHPKQQRSNMGTQGAVEATGDDRVLRHLRRQLPAAVLERIELVLRQHTDRLPPSNLLARPTSRPITDRMKAVQMPLATVQGIVYIAKEIGAWQHCCVHFPTFEREVEAFLTITGGDLVSAGRQENDFEGWKAIDPAWMALFFVICSIAIHQMSPEEGMQCSLKGESYRSRLASDLLHAAMDSLSLADYLVKPSIYSCQTIAILCVAGHNICGSDLLTSLLAIGIKTGQTLNLHALGKTASFLETCANQRSLVLAKAGLDTASSKICRLPDETDKQFAVWKKRIIDLEVGKRVWWAFTQQDYFAIPFSGCFSIVEGQYDTPLPHNCRDEDLEEGRLINRKVEELTVASKQRFTCHVAKIVCDFFEDLNKTKDTPRFSLVLHHEQRLRFVTDRFRACLNPDRLHTGHSQSMLPSFSTVLQHYLFISVNHKILVMHRAFLSRKVSAEERDLSHAASIETARSVLHELERGLGLNSDGGDKPQLDLQSRVHGGALWTIPYHSVAAATILALDIFKAPTVRPGGGQDHDHRLLRQQEVKRALNALSRLTKKSAIARRGCQLLSDLLEEGRRFDQRLGQRGKRKTSADVDSVMKRIRLPEDNDGDKAVRQIDSSALHATEPLMGSDHGRREQKFDSSWLDNFSTDTVRSEVTSSVYDGQTPDEPGASPTRPASFGYGSTHFNPLAGNSTSRAMHSGTNFGAPESLSSMFLSSDASVSGSGDPYDLFPTSLSHAQAQQTFSPGQARSMQPNGNSSHSQAQHTAQWQDDGSSTMWNGGMNNMTAPNVDINMPQQHLAQILPALESMPDVWKLFDGTLGQSLVAFEESGF